MDRAPSYLSSAKAELCLSELRPTKVRTEALICINVFLDELLWLVLSSARSFSTERLKIGLLKALPTTLGKEALLEAEVELRAYWEKSGHAVLKAIETAPVPSSSDFPLQTAFELLRHKCEAYSTLGELDEDPEVEGRLQARMAQASPTVPPNINAVAPAALYLTAVIEHVCEHVLSNVARVVARNSSQASAHVTDLYAALCEDETIYNLFRTMKVYEQIERQSKSQRPHKSKSFSRLQQNHQRTLSRVSSSSPLPPPLGSDLQLRARSSAESSIRQYAGGFKPSMEKARGLKLFKNGNSESNGYTPEHHDRAPSVVGSIIMGQGGYPDEGADDFDDGAFQDFDDLMRSGTTMKVSLTPDRLKTLEVYNKQKSLRAGAKPPSTSAEGNNQAKPTLRPAASSKSLPKSFSRDVDEILEPVPPAPVPRSRSRNGSFSGALFGGSSSNGSGLKRKASMNNTTPVSSLDRKLRTDMTVDTGVGNHKRNRPQKGRARNRESLDLDDVLDGDEDLGERVPMTPKAAVPSGISTNTRDLIDFLAEGPPEPPPSPPRSQTPVPNEKPKGRFGRMVSRLGRGTSTEQLNHLPPPSSAGQAVALSGGVPIQRSQTIVSGVTRTPSQLKKQRSHGNLSHNGSGTSLNNIPLPLVPLPRPPAMVPNRAYGMGLPPSPSHSTEHHTTQSAPPTEVKRQLSIHRKAVPQWDGDASTASPHHSSATNSPTVDRKRPSGIVTTSASAPGTPRENAFATPPPSAKKRDTPFIPERAQSIAIGPSSISPSPIRSNSSSTSISVSTKYIPSLPAAQTPDVQEMRRMVAKATSVAEAKLLVDMFLAQWGFPVVTADSTTAVVENALSAVEQQYGQHGAGVIELLLGDGTVDEPAEPVRTQNKHPAAPSLIITPTATSASSAASSPAGSKPPPVLPARSPSRSPSRPPSATPSLMTDKPQRSSLHGMPHAPAPAPAAVMV